MTNDAFAPISTASASDVPADPVAAVTHADPYGYYAQLRAGPPLVWDARLGLWVASRAEVIQALLLEPALRVRPVSEPVPVAIAGQPAGELFGYLVRMNDGPVHTTQRPVLQRALAGLDLSAVHAQALTLAHRLAQDIHVPLADAVFDIPLQAVAQLLGFEDDALSQVAAWSRDFVACLSPLSDARQLDAASVAAMQLLYRFEALIATRPSRAASVLSAVQLDAGAGRPVSRALLANLAGLLSQTCDATAGLLGNSLIALVRQPDLRTLASTRDGLRAIVEETARHDPSVHNTRRFAAHAVAVDDTTIEPGQAVLLVLAAANRDPAFNPAPDTFQPERATRRMPGFGHGPHACPGQALACTLAAAGLQALRSVREGEIDALRMRGWSYRPSVNARIPLLRGH